MWIYSFPLFYGHIRASYQSLMCFLMLWFIHYVHNHIHYKSKIEKLNIVNPIQFQRCTGIEKFPINVIFINIIIIIIPFVFVFVFTWRRQIQVLYYHLVAICIQVSEIRKTPQPHTHGLKILINAVLVLTHGLNILS